MKKKSRTRILIIIGIMVVIILLGIVYIFVSPLQELVSAPVVVIISPSQGDMVAVDGVYIVQSSVRDDGQFIDRVELWSMENEIFTLIEQISFLGEDHLISLTHGWLPTSVGSTRLIVRAYNDDGNHGDAAVDLVVVENPEEATLSGPVEGELVPPMGGYGAEGGILEGGSEEYSPEPPLEEFEEEFGPFQLFENLIFPILWDTFIPAINLTSLQIEALEFTVDETYIGVYCYVALESYPTERVPGSGYFDTADQIHWNIADHLGGNNAVTIPVLLDQSLDIHLECEGVKGNNQTVSLGQLDATHPPVDWNGQTFQASGSGGEGFTITYRINPVVSELIAPEQLHEVKLGQQNTFHWLWEGDPNDIDGFRIYRDGSQVANVPSNVTLFPVSSWWTEPLCGEEYEYHVVAFKGGEESAPSNNLLFQGEMCVGLNDIRDVSSQSLCDGVGNKFRVRYEHFMPPGQAYVGIQVFNEGLIVPEFSSPRSHISKGIGTVYIPVIYSGEESISTDQIVVTMFDNQDQIFYYETFDLPFNWTPGSPDLYIRKATINLVSNKMRIVAGNNGCAVAPATNVLTIRESDGQRGLVDIPQIGPRQEVPVFMDILPESSSLWSGEINLMIDPLENILESNEGNNDYQIGAVRFKELQIYKIDIHNDHDKYTKGEWRINFEVSRTHGGVWEVPQRGYKGETWGESGHTLSNLVFSPNLEENDTLLLHVYGEEGDWLDDRDWLGCMALYFSPDGNPNGAVESLDPQGYGYDCQFSLLNNWKEGGDYSIDSNTGDYTLYFRIILER